MTVRLFKSLPPVVVLLCTGLILQGCNPSKEANGTLQQLQGVQTALQRVEAELVSLRQGIPQETEQKLRALEDSLEDPKRWPHDATTAEEMRQRFDEIVQTLSPLAPGRILRQLDRLNWGIEALWNLRTHSKVAPDQLEEVQEIITEMLARHPAGYFDEIRRELESRLKEIEPKVREYQVKQLLERANRALEDKDEDASAVLSSLEEFQGEKQVAAILPKLRQKILEKTSLELIENCQENLRNSGSLADDHIRQMCLLTIRDEVLRLIIVLELEESTPNDEILKKATNLLASCDKELHQLTAKLEAEKYCRYQAWALQQIRSFDGPDGWYYDHVLPRIRSDLQQFRNADKDEDWVPLRVFPSLKQLIQEKLGVDLSETTGAMLTADKRKEIYNKATGIIGWKENIDTEIAYRTTRDGMVKFLLPIDSRLLDPPVAKLYWQAFEKGWQKLEGRDDQLHVAENSAVVRKKTLEEVAASDP